MADGAGVARLVLALVFLVAGWAKLSDRPGSQRAVADFGFPESLARPIGILLPIAELATAIALLVSAWSRVGGASAVALLAFFVVAISASLARGQRPGCNCFGQVHSAPIGPKTLARNIVLAAGAVLVVVEGPGNFISSWIDRGSATLWVAVGGGVAIAGLAWFVLNLTAQQGKLLERIDALEEGRGHDAHAHHAHGSGLPVGETAPAFSLPSTSGETVSLDGLLARGRPVVLVFASQECQACTEVLPDVARWQREYDDALTIAVLSGGDPDINKAKAVDNGLATIALQRTDEVAKAYGYMGTPGAVVVWSDGTIATPVVAGSDAVRDLIPHAATDLHRPSPSSPGPEVGDDAPPIELPDLGGRTVSLADLRGASTLVLFWRQSCGYCAGMLDELREWDRSRSNGAPQLLVVSTSTAAEHEGMDLVSPVVLDARGEAMAAYGANGTPIGLLVDGDGRVASGLAVGAVAVMELARS